MAIGLGGLSRAEKVMNDERRTSLFLALSGHMEMSAIWSLSGGGLNGSTQHFILKERWSVV